MVAKVIMVLFFVVHGGMWIHGTSGNSLFPFAISLLIIDEIRHLLMDQKGF